MKTQQNVNLANYTSFGTGGVTSTLITIEKNAELHEALSTCNQPIWFLGSGANVLISDDGLPGTTIHLDTKNIEAKDELYIADAGVEWDTLVQLSIDNNLWGLERTSGIPGSVGAAVVGNIAAYGQAVADTLDWVEVIDISQENAEAVCMMADELELSYRYSKFQTEEWRKFVITRAAFKLQTAPQPLEYASAIKVAEELSLDADNLKQRREVIMEARRRAGSLWDPKTKQIKTAGSFFRNPVVSKEQAELIMKFEEQKVTLADIQMQNKIHGGETTRVSAAHVLLAAGFTRGQTWGPVRLHPEHVLKIENTGGATSQQIYDVAQEIIKTVKEKLGIDLQPEVRFLGKFN